MVFPLSSDGYVDDGQHGQRTKHEHDGKAEERHHGFPPFA
jgi:hypothetical protein